MRGAKTERFGHFEQVAVDGPYRAMSGGRPRSGKTAKPSDSASACDMACSASAWLENRTMPRQVDGLLGDGFAPFFRSTVHATIVP